MIWFDGNRKAAENFFAQRGTVSKELLEIQMRRINNVDIEKTFNPIFYNTFDINGNFKDLEVISKDLLKLIENKHQ